MPRHPALRLAHRGVHEAAVENTIEAMRAAVAAPGIDGVEFDVQASRDGVPVLLHDDTLARTHGLDRRPGDLDAAELERLGVPTLGRVLATLPVGMTLDVELKSDVAAIVAPLLTARLESGGRLVASSFDADVLRALADVAPGVDRWLNAEALDEASVALARQLGCSAVSARHTTIDADTVAEAAAAGLDVAAWTATEAGEVARLEALGCVAICVEGAALRG